MNGVFQITVFKLHNIAITKRSFILKREPFMEYFNEILNMQTTHDPYYVVATIDCSGLYYHLRLSDYDVVDCIEYSDLVKFHPDALV
jgi:hypothetical protein